MVCEQCISKQEEINRLKEEVESLKNKLNYQSKKSKKGFFGSSTPSSQNPFKKNSEEKQIGKKGGGKNGHKGYGRKNFAENEIDEIREIEPIDKCPYCKKSGLENKDIANRDVIDIEPIKIKRIRYRSKRLWCPHCCKTVTNPSPVLPKSLYGNRLIACVMTLYLVHGIPLRKIIRILGIPARNGSLHNIFHRISGYWKGCIGKLVKEYRNAKVKHADETSWRTDGQNGYSWLFNSDFTSIFKFTDTRSSKIAFEVFGTRKLPGVLVVDRYNGYNKVPCKIQYCYVHLLRNLKDIGEKFINNLEVQSFTDALIPFLVEAITLRSMDITNKEYYKRANFIKKKILRIIHSQAEHPAIRDFQWIFIKNAKRLYHWCRDRDIPADNNKAEREFRPTVIARKVSFGSQSEQGADTRSVLMSILHTVNKRLSLELPRVEEWVKEVLDKMVLHKGIDVYPLIPPVQS